jgi:hypothetical protein
MSHEHASPLHPGRDVMTLSDLIAELRREIASELPLKLHAGQQSPTEADEESFGHMTGLPFSRAFDRFLSGNHGGDFLASDSFTEIRDHCRREHWREGHTGDNPTSWNLCARLAIAAVELRQPLTFIAEQEDIDLWLVRNLLTSALEHAKEWREERKAGVRIGDESRLQLDEAEALPVVLAREHSVIAEQRIWELWREKFPYLRSWESELARRRAFHATHCYAGCGLLMDDAA